MSDPLDASTPSANETDPEPEAPEDPARLQSAQNLDEDELGTDPLERGVEPAEAWSPVAKRRPTPREQREGESLDERLAEEREDSADEAVEDSPLGEAGMHELDELAEPEQADGEQP